MMASAMAERMTSEDPLELKPVLRLFCCSRNLDCQWARNSRPREISPSNIDRFRSDTTPGLKARPALPRAYDQARECACELSTSKSQAGKEQVLERMNERVPIAERQHANCLVCLEAKGRYHERGRTKTRTVNIG